jgi:hypothetical protein
MGTVAPPKLTKLAPCTAPKPVPWIVTTVPGPPIRGDIVVIEGETIGLTGLLDPPLLPQPIESERAKTTNIVIICFIGLIILKFAHIGNEPKNIVQRELLSLFQNFIN